MPIIMPYKGIHPKIHPSAFIAKGAVIIGDVEIGAQSTVWFGCVVRGDVNYIRIGERTNIQDGSVIHVTRNTHPTFIGDGVTLGHKVLLHGCNIESNSFIGMGATAMDGATVENGAMLAAGSLLTPNKTVPKGKLWAGNPAKYFRDMTDDEIAFIPKSADNYINYSQDYINANT